jgi:hypothetical protein
MVLGLALTVLAYGPPAPPVERYALSMFHFNVQYVAGGLVGFPGSAIEYRPTDVEDQIVVESLAPVLDLYAAHPTWGANIEMQGYLLDVLAERHPDVLDLLRDLATSGQIEVVSFHYSDQLFIGYPQLDWAKSQALARETFEKHEIPLGTTVFCQEGQSGMAMADRMAELGYQTMVWPKNLWFAQHGDFVPAPLYDFGEIELVLGAAGAAYDDGKLVVETTWTFFDDGELLATNDWNPYFPELFVHTPEAVAEYEANLEALEADGWIITTVRDYADAIRGRVATTATPPLLDGTWQPGSTEGVGKWLGVRSLYFLGGPPADRDTHVRTLGYVAHRELVAAEAAAQVARLDARAQLDAAWRLLALGQVTDASGINPYRGEVEYGIAHTAEATRIARDVIEDAKAAVGIDGAALVDPEAGTLVAGDEDPFAGERADAVVQVDIAVEDPTRTTSTAWERITDGHHRVAVTIGPGDPEVIVNAVDVTFRGEATDELVTTLALADDEPYTFSRSDFTFGGFKMALPIGLVSLGPNLFLIKDTAHVHLAAAMTVDSGDITFRDETLARDEGATWVFHVFEGSAEEAVALANRINTMRRLVR